MSTNSEELDSSNYAVTEGHIAKPMKKAHRVGNKTIIVLDETLVKRLSIDELHTWFEEEEYGNGILLKVHKYHALNGEE